MTPLESSVFFIGHLCFSLHQLVFFVHPDLRKDGFDHFWYAEGQGCGNWNSVQVLGEIPPRALGDMGSHGSKPQIRTILIIIHNHLNHLNYFTIHGIPFWRHQILTHPHIWKPYLLKSLNSWKSELRSKHWRSDRSAYVWRALPLRPGDFQQRSLDWGTA